MDTLICMIDLLISVITKDKKILLTTYNIKKFRARQPILTTPDVFFKPLYRQQKKITFR